MHTQKKRRREEEELHEATTMKNFAPTQHNQITKKPQQRVFWSTVVRCLIYEASDIAQRVSEREIGRERDREYRNVFCG